MRPSASAIAGLAIVAAVAVAIRFTHVGLVYDGGTVNLVADTDPHYHVLQAERILHRAPGAPWFDPNLDWPNGAPVPWPPLFDAVLAGAAAAVHGAGAGRDEISAVAAAVPPVMGAISAIAVGALAAALLGARRRVLASLLLALLPAHGELTPVGRPDQHAMELVVAPALWLAFVVAWNDPRLRARRAATAALAVLVAVAFWTWMGSAFMLAFPALAVALLHLTGADASERARRALFLGAGGGAMLLAASLLVLGPPGALFRTAAIGLTGLHLAICAGCASFAGLLAASARWRRGPVGPTRRALEVLVALALPLAVLLGGSAQLREGALGGLVPLRAAGGWYADIAEFQPLVGSGHQPLAAELFRVLHLFGLVPLLALGAALASLRPRREETRPGPATVVGLAWMGALVLFAAARYRFTPYATLLLAPFAADAMTRLADAIARRTGRPWTRPPSIAALLVLALLPTFPQWLQPLDRLDRGVVETLDWLGHQPPRPDGREGVAAMWDYGHAVQYYARRPALGTPFGTEAGASSLTYLAWFAFATDDDVAEQILRRRRVGYVLLDDPLRLALDVRNFAPAGSPEVARIMMDWSRGSSIEPLAGLLPLVISRLAVLDGGGTPSGQAPLAGFRLLYETKERRRPLKLFGSVEGARLAVEGAVPRGKVSARVEVTTNAGRTFTFQVTSPTDATGRAILRMPYATGANGASSAGSVVVTDGRGLAEVPVPEAAVLRGLEARVPLRSGRSG
ncbi:MAG TPA: STT3 domain-containing protein [Anaeromyxobacter sp.]